MKWKLQLQYLIKITKDKITLPLSLKIKYYI